MWQCYESGSIPFVLDLLIFVYLGLLQLVGIILAFQTRKVRIPILNDSKSVTALIYISSIVLVVIVLITFILRGYINICAAIFSGGVILLATFFLVLSFIPKVSCSFSSILLPCMKILACYIRELVDSVYKDDTGEISRDPCTKRLKSR